MTGQRLKKRLASATVCGAMLAMLSACAPASRGDFCEIYKPVYTVPSDTAETKAMTDDNNAVWLELCGG